MEPLYNEHPDYPGFFITPLTKHVILSKNFEVLNIHTGNVLKAIVRNHGYLSVNPDCYANNIKIERQFLLHRLIASVFISIPKELKELGIKLQVNHKDGNKLNNDPNNLEWCIPKKNMQHAFENKLISIGSNVLARDIRTDEVKKFPSIISCAKYFDIQEKTLKRHLDSSRAGKITKDWHVFKYDNEHQWAILTEKEKSENRWGFASVILAKKIDSDIVHICNTLKEFCETHGYSYFALKSYRQRYGSDRPFQDWIFQECSNLEQIDLSKIKSRNIERYKKDKRLFQITNLLTSETKTIVGLSALANELDCSKIHLSSLIKESNIVVENKRIQLLDIQGQTGITMPKV